MLVSSKQELSDLLFRRMLCEVKLVKTVVPEDNSQDYRIAIIDACQRLIRTMETTERNRKIDPLRRSLR